MLLWFGWFCIYGVFTTAAVVIRDSSIITPNLINKTVNMALETILEFNHKEHRKDMSLLNKVENVIKEIKQRITDHNLRQRDFKLKQFTDLLFVITKILNNYDDDHLRLFFNTFDGEIKKYKYNKSYSHPLTENFNFKTFIMEKFDEIRGLSIIELRKKMADLAKKIVNEDYTENEKRLIDYLNTLYKQEDLDKFYDILMDIDDFGMKSKNSMDLQVLLKEGTNILFDIYTKLAKNISRHLDKNVVETTTVIIATRTTTRATTKTTARTTTTRPTTKTTAKTTTARTTTKKRQSKQKVTRKMPALRMREPTSDRHSSDQEEEVCSGSDDFFSKEFVHIYPPEKQLGLEHSMLVHPNTIKSRKQIIENEKKNEALKLNSLETGIFERNLKELKKKLSNADNLINRHAKETSEEPCESEEETHFNIKRLLSVLKQPQDEEKTTRPPQYEYFTNPSNPKIVYKRRITDIVSKKYISTKPTSTTTVRKHIRFLMKIPT